jgi:hypothetical protein
MKILLLSSFFPLWLYKSALTCIDIVDFKREMGYGRRRILRNHFERDPNDNKLAVAAGQNRRFEIRGDGKALLSGSRARIYIFENNYNSVMELKFIPNSSLDDLIETKVKT